MSNLKRFAIVLAAEILLIVIGLIKGLVTVGDEKTGFLSEYMLGYSIPIVVMGMIAFLCVVVLMRSVKSGDQSSNPGR